MEFEKIVAPSPKELFVEQIVKAILAGRLRPGDRLPTERELAEKMGPINYEVACLFDIRLPKVYV